VNDNPGVHKIELHQPKKAFAIIPNMAVRDPKLSANSFRLLAYLLSHNDGYELTYRQIEKQTGLGRYAINAASKQLGERGWLRVEQTKLKNGQFGPKSWTLLSPEANEPVAGQSTADSFHSGTANGLKKTKTREDKQVEKTIDIESAFNSFWAIYPKKDDKGLARRSFEKALKRASLEQTVAGAEKYRDDPNREQAFTKNPSTWLNADAWENGPLPSRVVRKPRKLTNAEEGALLVAKWRAEEEAQKPKEIGYDMGNILKGVDDE
jgi:predicted transcriptional regulator